MGLSSLRALGAMLVVSLALTLGALAAPSASFAQSTAQTRAAASFASATEAFNAERYEDALAGFLRAYELAPHDAVHFNIAVCLERLARYGEALDRLDRVIASAALPADLRARATEARGRVMTHLGVLRIRGAHERAFVDGTESCTLPCEIVVAPGEHAIRYDHETSSHSVPVGAGETVVADHARETAVAVAEEAPPAAVSEPVTGLSPLFYVGAGVAVVGLVCIVGCGLHADGLSSSYAATPTPALYSEGTTFRDLTNISIGVSIAGAALALVDLLVLNPPGRPLHREASVAVGPGSLRVTF